MRVVSVGLSPEKMDVDTPAIPLSCEDEPIIDTGGLKMEHHWAKSGNGGPSRPPKGRKARGLGRSPISDTPSAQLSTTCGGLNPGNNVSAAVRAKLGRPRWFNQSFLVFMALRQAGTPLPRGELIRRALELDKQIGAERGLPPCFTGKVGP